MNAPDTAEGVGPGTALPWECHKRLPLIHHWKQGPTDSTGNVLIAEVGAHRDAELEPFNGERWLQDARYIVTACNAYPDLVAALEKLDAWAGKMANGATWHYADQDVAKEARAALAKARP